MYSLIPFRSSYVCFHRVRPPCFFVLQRLLPGKYISWTSPFPLQIAPTLSAVRRTTAPNLITASFPDIYPTQYTRGINIFDPPRVAHLWPVLPLSDPVPSTVETCIICAAPASPQTSLQTSPLHHSLSTYFHIHRLSLQFPILHRSIRNLIVALYMCRPNSIARSRTSVDTPPPPPPVILSCCSLLDQ